MIRFFVYILLSPLALLVILFGLAVTARDLFRMLRKRRAFRWGSAGSGWGTF